MPAAVLHLDGDRIIEQGSRWQMEFLYPGDITGAYLRGQIRKDYGSPDVIAPFQTPPPDYLIEVNSTRFILFLNSRVTAKIPLPEPRSDGEGYWRYDLLLQLPSEEPRRLLQGRVYISPGVTVYA